MSNYITAAHIQEYATNVELLLQQRGSKLQDAVTVKTGMTGKAATVVEQIGAVTAQQKVSRHSDTPLIETPHNKRWVFPSDFEFADLIDTQDKLRINFDPTSPYVQNGAFALGRARDDVIIAAMFADAKTGENGSTTTSFPTSTNRVGTDVGGTSSGLNVAKLRAGRKILAAGHVDFDFDTVYMAISAQQNDDLLSEIEVISKDYNSKSALDVQSGKVMNFMGINFIHSERLLKTSTTRRNPMWVKSGVSLAIWNDRMVDIGVRRDKSLATQVYLCETIGATRIEEGKVVEILSTEP